MIAKSEYKRKTGLINLYNASTLSVTLEYFTIVDRIINNTYIEYSNSIFSQIKNVSSFASKPYKEKSFFEKASFFLSTVNDVIKTVSIDLKVESLNTYKESLKKVYLLPENHSYAEGESYKDMIDELLKKHPAYQQIKDEFNRHKDLKTQKIEYMNNLIIELNKFRQYILDEFNPLVERYIESLGDEGNHRSIQYKKVMELIVQNIDYGFKSTSLKTISSLNILIECDDLSNNIKILKEDIKALDNEIDKILENDFFKNYINNVLKYFHTIKSKLNLLITQNESKINKLPKIQKDIELENLKKELKSLESTLQTLIEQKTECLNDIEEFNREYNLRLGGLIREILNLRKEILYKKTIKQQKLKARYQEDLQTLDETQQTIDELKDTISQLEEALESIDESHEQYDEIKKAHEELFEELRKLEEELETQEQELEFAKEFIEDETIEEEYEEAQSHYDEYENSYEQIKESFKDVKELSDDEKTELKKLYKKAARLCHPDIVPHELKEKATEMMQLLNEAYAKKDLLKVKEILYSLENGTVFECSSDTIEDKDHLKAKIEEYRQNINAIESELEELKQDDTYQTIADLDDWDGYFEELKSELEKEKVQLEEEAREVLKETNEEIKTERIEQPTKTKPTTTIQKESNTPYANHILSIENPNFEKIRRYCNNLADENQSDAMQEYLGINGKMHKALIYDALEQFAAELNGETITVIDWGCGQGIASMLVIDYIREKQLNIKVSHVILIDDEPKELSRAMTQVEALSHDKIKSIAMKSDDSSIFETIKSVKNGSVLNLFANDKMPMDYLEIDYDVFENAYFMCVSNVNQEFVDEIYEDMNTLLIGLQELSSRNGKIGRFERYERIFKISETNHNIPAIDVDNDEIPF